MYRMQADHINIKEENAGKLRRSCRKKHLLRKWSYEEIMVLIHPIHT